MGKLIDLTGQRFGSLIVLEKAEPRKYARSRAVMWKCRCDCGIEKDILSQQLLSGKTTSCGNHRIKDYTGERFGRLVVLEQEIIKDDHGKRITLCRCKCDCGNEKHVRISNLTSGSTKSCGCYAREQTRSRSRKHGCSHSRIDNIYKGMKQRCNNKNNSSYPNYGGRGIRVCEEWNKPDGLESFMAWALSHGYREDLTIERKDVNGDYSPDNCTWIPKSEQSRNRRSNVYVEYDGERMLEVDFASKIGVSLKMVNKMLKKSFTTNEIAERYGK